MWAASNAGLGGDAGAAAAGRSACTGNCNGMEASSLDSSGSEGVDADVPCTAPVANPSGAACGAWVNRTQGTDASGKSWSAVASDASGDKLVAGSRFAIPSGCLAHGQRWASVASDSTGTHLVAVAVHPHSLGGCDILNPTSAGYAGGSIWTSTDGGATWTDQTPAGPAIDLCWASVASDSSGTNLIAVGSGIWTSVNAGVTWTQQTAPPTTTAGAWVSVASDSTGTHLVAVNGAVFSANGDIWASTDSGVTWTNQTSGTSAAHQAWSAVASDSTGAHLVAVVSGGDIWTN